MYNSIDNKQFKLSTDFTNKYQGL